MGNIVDSKTPVLRPEDEREQIDQRGLSGARFANNGDGLIRRNANSHLFKNLRFRSVTISEAHAIEAYASRKRSEQGGSSDLLVPGGGFQRCNGFAERTFTFTKMTDGSLGVRSMTGPQRRPS